MRDGSTTSEEERSDRDTFEGGTQESDGRRLLGIRKSGESKRKRLGGDRGGKGGAAEGEIFKKRRRQSRKLKRRERINQSGAPPFSFLPCRFFPSATL